jgi:hypothetical protein
MKNHHEISLKKTLELRKQKGLSMNMKKKLSILAACVLMIAGLAGCNNGDNTSSGTVSGTVSSGNAGSVSSGPNNFGEDVSGAISGAGDAISGLVSGAGNAITGNHGESSAVSSR